MLVIVSDLHLTDGTSTASIHPGSFEVFAQRVREMAERASWRSDGRYQPIESVDIVLLGDAIDVTRSAQWLHADVRPWGDPQAPEFAQTVASIVDGALQHNEPALAVLRSLVVEGGMSVPAGDSRGRPLYDSPLHSVPVNIHYMVGDNDWPLHLPGASYDMIRQEVARHIGLCHAASEPFPHDAAESPSLLASQRRHHLLARHGDIFDPVSFAGDRNSSSLGEVIALQMVQRFVVEVERQHGEMLPETTLAGLAELDDVRPVLLAPVWIEGLLERTCRCLASRKRVQKIWDELADDVLAMPLVRQHDGLGAGDVVDGLAKAIKFSKRPSVGWAEQITAWLQQMRGAACPSYRQHALCEPEFRNRRAQHIVYGHTHIAETAPLDTSFADGYVLNQMYFNAGTWRRVHRGTHAAVTGHEFVPNESISFLTFYAGDERGGCPYEVWHGTLGVAPVTGRQSQQAREQYAAPSSVPLNGPHFLTGVGAAREANSWAG